MLNKIIVFLFLFVGTSIVSRSQNYQICHKDIDDAIFNCDTAALYLSGELHHYKKNEEIRFDLIKSLHVHKNVRILLVEGGYCMGIVLDNYVLKKDSIGEKLISTVEELNFYRKIREFNAVQNESEKIKIIGIDLSSGDNFFLLPALKSLWPQNNQIDSCLNSCVIIYNAIKQSESLNWKSSLNTDKLYSAVKYDLEKNDLLMNKFWGVNFNVLKKIIKIQEEARRIENSKSDYYLKFNEREKYMYNLVTEISNDYKGMKMFGQFGRAHIPKIYLKNWYKFKNWESFAARLNNSPESPVKGKVVNFFIYYPNRRKDRISDPIKFISKTLKESDVNPQDCRVINLKYFYRKYNLISDTGIDYIITNF